MLFEVAIRLKISHVPFTNYPDYEQHDINIILLLDQVKTSSHIGMYLINTFIPMSPSILQKSS
jgi:hypothetical protein